jgi:hypothetical protein
LSALVWSVSLASLPAYLVAFVEEDLASLAQPFTSHQPIPYPKSCKFQRINKTFSLVASLS